MGVDGEEMRTGGVNTRNDEVGANVTLVAEQVLLQHGHAGNDAGLAAGGEGVQFEVRGDDGGGELGVGGGTGTRAPDVRGYVVEFLAVLRCMSDQCPWWWLSQRLWRGRAYLVCYNGTAGSSCVCCDDYAAVEETAHNGRSCAGRLGQRDALGVESRIAVVVGEVEAAHGVGVRCRWRRGVFAAETACIVVKVVMSRVYSGCLGGRRRG